MKRRAMRLAAVLCTALASGCTSAAFDIQSRTLADATCSGTLSFRLFGDDTSPVKLVAQPATGALFDFIDSVNATGGIRGCQVEAQYADTAYDPAKAVEAYNGWKAQASWSNVSTLIGIGSDMMRPVATLAAADEKLVLLGGFNGDLASPVPVQQAVSVPFVNDSFTETSQDLQKTSNGYPYVFFPGTDYSTAARVAMAFVAQQSGKRVGFFHCEESYTFCIDPVYAASSYLKETGSVALGRRLMVSMTLQPTDISTVLVPQLINYFAKEVKRSQDDPTYAPVDWVWLGNTGASVYMMGGAIRAALGYVNAGGPLLDGGATSIAPNTYAVKVIANNFAIDENLDTLSQGYSRGFWYGVQPISLYGDMLAPGMSDLLTVHDTYRAGSAYPPGGTASTYQVVHYVYGYTFAILWKKAVEAVLDERKPVTGRNLKEAMEKLDRLDLGSITADRLTFTPTDHRPQGAEYIYHLDSTGKLVRVTAPLSLPMKDSWKGW